MNCAELQRVLPDIMEGDRTVEQEAHLRSCSACFDLVSDLNAIAGGARLLRESDEPSLRVWNSIETVLRREGLIHEPLIHEPQLQPVLIARPWQRWSTIWLLPAAATFLVVFGVLRYERGRIAPPLAQPETATNVAAVSLPHAAKPLVANRFAPGDSDDEQLLEVVGARSPAMRAAYEADLRNANAYIQDAEQSAQSNPNDEAAQRYVMDAYEQKSMVYEIALDRSLP